MTLINTLTKVAVDGANKKDTFRYKGKLVVVKEPIQQNSYDNVAEAIIYEMALLFGIDCSPAGLLSDGRAYSEIDEEVFYNLEQGISFLNIEAGSIYDIWNKLEMRTTNKEVKRDFIIMTLFDIATRQLDRNTTNFSFIKGDTPKLYRLYDNGLSLFSTVKYKDTLNFAMRTGDKALDVLDFCSSKFKEYDINKIDIFKTRYTPSNLYPIFIKYEDRIGLVSDNKIEDIVRWILRQQEMILHEFK